MAMLDADGDATVVEARAAVGNKRAKGTLTRGSRTAMESVGRAIPRYTARERKGMDAVRRVCRDHTPVRRAVHKQGECNDPAQSY